MSDYDPMAVAFYDIAHEGAQVRAIASALSLSLERLSSEPEVGAAPGLASLAGVRARSIIILCADDLSARCAQLAAALMEPTPVPIVIAHSLPGYIGALDVLVVLSEKSEELQVSKAISQAVSRGVPTVVVAPADAAIVAEAPRNAIIVPPVPNTLGPSPTRLVVAVVALLEIADFDPLLVIQRLNDWAERIDEELAACSPERDELVNPARQLAQLSGVVIHTAAEPIGVALSNVIAALWTMRGKASGHLSLAELAAGLQYYPLAQTDLFFDPLIDEAPTASGQPQSLKPIVWCAAEEHSPGLPGAVAATTENPTAPSSVLQLLARGFAATIFHPAS
jgi:hypothetical protein